MLARPRQAECWIVEREFGAVLSLSLACWESLLKPGV